MMQIEYRHALGRFWKKQYVYLYEERMVPIHSKDFSWNYLKFFCFFKNEQAENGNWILCARIRTFGISTMVSVQHIFLQNFTKV